MSDDPIPFTTTDAKTAEVVSATVPSTSAPAVHDDRLWDGPRYIYATKDPVWVETKTEYWDLLNRHGKQMKDQAESTTGPDLAPTPDPIPLFLQPTTPPEPLTHAEARCIAAMSTVFRRYAIREALYCQRCFSRNREHGCRQRIADDEVAIACRCGRTSYRPPTGTTDTVIGTLATQPVRDHTETTTVIHAPTGAHTLPTLILTDLEARVIIRYAQLLREREYDPRWFCRNCWDGVTMDAEVAMGIKISDTEIVLLCPCRLRFWRG